MSCCEVIIVALLGLGHGSGGGQETEVVRSLADIVVDEIGDVPVAQDVRGVAHEEVLGIDIARATNVVAEGAVSSLGVHGPVDVQAGSYVLDRVPVRGVVDVVLLGVSRWRSLEAV